MAKATKIPNALERKLASERIQAYAEGKTEKDPVTTSRELSRVLDDIRIAEDSIVHHEELLAAERGALEALKARARGLHQALAEVTQ